MHINAEWNDNVLLSNCYSLRDLEKRLDILEQSYPELKICEKDSP